MSHTVPIEQASGKLSELVSSLAPGDEIVLTANDQPVARIVPTSLAQKSAGVAGAWRGKFEILEDGDEIILQHFKEYLP